MQHRVLTECDRSETAISVPERAYGAPQVSQSNLMSQLLFRKPRCQFRTDFGDVSSPCDSFIIYASTQPLDQCKSKCAASVNKAIAFSYWCCFRQQGHS